MLMTSQRQMVKQVIKDEGLAERVEAAAVMKIKNDYLDFAEEDCEFSVDGVLISIEYVGMSACVHADLPDEPLIFRLVFDDINEQISAFDFSDELRAD